MQITAKVRDYRCARFCSEAELQARFRMNERCQMTMLRSLTVVGLAIVLIASLGFAQTPSINSGGIVLNSNGSSDLIFGQWWEIYGTNLSTCTQTWGASQCAKVTTDWTNYYNYYACYGTCGWYFWYGGTVLNYTSQSSTQDWWYESGTQINVKPGFFYDPWGCPIEAQSCQYFGSINDMLRVCNSLGNCSAWYDTGIL